MAAQPSTKASAADLPCVDLLAMKRPAVVQSQTSCFVRRTLTATCLTVTAVMVYDHAANGAQAAPASSRPIMLLLPTAAGGGPDIVGRVTRSNMRPRLNTVMVVANQPGAPGEDRDARRGAFPSRDDLAAAIAIHAAITALSAVQK